MWVWLKLLIDSCFESVWVWDEESRLHLYQQHKNRQVVNTRKMTWGQSHVPLRLTVTVFHPCSSHAQDGVVQVVQAIAKLPFWFRVCMKKSPDHPVTSLGFGEKKKKRWDNQLPVADQTFQNHIARYDPVWFSMLTGGECGWWLRSYASDQEQIFLTVEKQLKSEFLHIE